MISRRERRWLWFFSVTVMLLTVLPYLFAFGLTPPGTRYQWLLYNPDEPNVHLAWMRQAFDGHLLFIDPFTTETQQPTFFHLLFLFLGTLARIPVALGSCSPHQSLLLTYHLFRVVAGILLLQSVYCMTAHFFPSVRIRKTAVWIAATSSGWGWLAFALAAGGASQSDPVLFGLRPVDVSRGLMIPEGFTFPSLLLYPLFTFSMFLMICCFLSMLRAFEKVGATPLPHLAIAALCGLVLGNVHTYDLLVVYAILGVWTVWGFLHRKPTLRDSLKATLLLGVFVVLSCGGIVYQFINFRLNPVFREKALTLTPPHPPADMLVSYGFVFLLALFGALAALRCGRSGTFLCLWLIVGSLILYTPVSFSRKMIEGLHLPMSVLAAVGLTRLINAFLWGRRRKPGWGRQRRLWRTGGALAAIAIMSLSNLQFLRLVGEWFADNNLSRARVLMPPYCISEDDLAAAGWLERNTPRESAVLCSPFLGSYLPSLTGNPVFVGHWAETLRFGAKFDWFAKFLRGQDSLRSLPPSAVARPIRYLLYGQYEHLISPDFVPTTEWRMVFQKADSTVYQLRTQP